VDHHAGIWKRVALALGAGRQKNRTHAGALAHAIGVDVALEELHRVIDRKTCSDRSARAMHVDVNILLRFLGLQEQQLRNRKVCHVVVDRRANKNYPLFQEA